MKPYILRKIRQELRLNLADFATVSGLVSRQRVWSIENGKRQIGARVVNKIVNHLASNGYDIAIDTDTYITLNGVKMKV